MHSMMFEFLRIQFLLDRIDADAVNGFVPAYITQVEAQEILQGGTET